MPSLEQIIRPFVVDPTTPPVPVVVALNKPPPEPVRLNIGIGGTRLKDLGSNVAPIAPPPVDTSTISTKPKISFKDLSSSYSFSVTNYMTGVVKEQAQRQTDPFIPTGFGIGAGITGGFDPFAP